MLLGGHLGLELRAAAPPFAGDHEHRASQRQDSDDNTDGCEHYHRSIGLRVILLRGRHGRGGACRRLLEEHRSSATGSCDRKRTCLDKDRTVILTILLVLNANADPVLAWANGGSRCQYLRPTSHASRTVAPNHIVGVVRTSKQAAGGESLTVGQIGNIIAINSDPQRIAIALVDVIASNLRHLPGEELVSEGQPASRCTVIVEGKVDL